MSSCSAAVHRLDVGAAVAEEDDHLGDVRVVAAVDLSSSVAAWIAGATGVLLLAFRQLELSLTIDSTFSELVGVLEIAGQRRDQPVALGRHKAVLVRRLTWVVARRAVGSPEDSTASPTRSVDGSKNLSRLRCRSWRRQIHAVRAVLGWHIEPDRSSTTMTSNLWTEVSHGPHAAACAFTLMSLMPKMRAKPVETSADASIVTLSGLCNPGSCNPC